MLAASCIGSAAGGRGKSAQKAAVREVTDVLHRPDPTPCTVRASTTFFFFFFLQLHTFQPTHKGLDKTLKRISSLALFCPASDLKMSHPPLLGKLRALKRHSAYNLCPSLAPDKTANKSFWDFSERQLFITSPWPEWCAQRRRSPSPPRAGWLPRLHSKVTQLGFVPASIRMWLTYCAFSVWTDVIFGPGQGETVPPVQVRDYVFKESGIRRKKKNKTKQEICLNLPSLSMNVNEINIQGFCD